MSALGSKYGGGPGLKVFGGSKGLRVGFGGLRDLIADRGGGFEDRDVSKMSALGSKCGGGPGLEAFWLIKLGLSALRVEPGGSTTSCIPLPGGGPVKVGRFIAEKASISNGQGICLNGL